MGTHKPFKGVLLLFSVVILNSIASAQCYIEADPHGALFRVFRRSIPEAKPEKITFATKLGNIYEIPFAFIAQCSFVKAGNVPYFYFYTSKEYRDDETDYKANDTARFYFSNNTMLEFFCEGDYPGRKSQTISFYKLDKAGLDQLSTVALDSIIFTSHLHLNPKSKPAKSADQIVVVRKLSKRNSTRIKEWAVCLKDQF